MSGVSPVYLKIYIILPFSSGAFLSSTPRSKKKHIYQPGTSFAYPGVNVMILKDLHTSIHLYKYVAIFNVHKTLIIHRYVLQIKHKFNKSSSKCSDTSGLAIMILRSIHSFVALTICLLVISHKHCCDIHLLKFTLLSTVFL